MPEPESPRDALIEQTWGLYPQQIQGRLLEAGLTVEDVVGPVVDSGRFVGPTEHVFDLGDLPKVWGWPDRPVTTDHPTPTTAVADMSPGSSVADLLHAAEAERPGDEEMFGPGHLGPDGNWIKATGEGEER